MARIKCVGCERVAHLRKYDEIEGFAVCRQCNAVFDVSPDVVERAPSGVADLVAHGEIPEPRGVRVHLQGTDLEAPRLTKGYRGNAREAIVPRMLLIQYWTKSIWARWLASAMTLVAGASILIMFRGLSREELWVRVLVSIFLGVPGLCLFYFVLVGLLNRVRIRIDDGLVQIDEGPLPFPHQKIKLPIVTIERVCCHFIESTFRGHPTKRYQLEAWLRSGRRETLVAGIERVATAIYLQQRIVTFLGLDSIGPVEYKSYKADPDFFGE